MRSGNTRSWMGALMVPAAIAYGSLLSKLPRWLNGTTGVALAASQKKKQLATAEAVDAIVQAVPTECPATALESSMDTAPSLVDEMLDQGRHALLLRPQIIDNLTADQQVRTRTALADAMCLVPAGEVVVNAWGEFREGRDAVVQPTAPIRVQAYYLDRFAVSNAKFQNFVDCGGYEQLAIWHQEIWPAVLDFVDQTGYPGPRFWRKGRHLAGEENRPIVGICWYEAWAYARWTGKRLSTDAEWVKAGSWPIAMAGRQILQRRYPWGDAMDHDRANLWGSGPGSTVPVDCFPQGVSVGGVQQLIGNVWEWTSDAFAYKDAAQPDGYGAHSTMKSIRGGAFDTYLDSQASCQFQSGDEALARKHNIGFRCAINMCDIVKDRHSCERRESEEVGYELAEVPS